MVYSIYVCHIPGCLYSLFYYWYSLFKIERRSILPQFRRNNIYSISKFVYQVHAFCSLYGGISYGIIPCRSIYNDMLLPSANASDARLRREYGRDRHRQLSNHRHPRVTNSWWPHRGRQWQWHRASRALSSQRAGTIYLALLSIYVSLKNVFVFFEST